MRLNFRVFHLMARISPVPVNTPEEDDGVKMPQKLMTRTLNLKTQTLRMPMRPLSSDALTRQISEKDSHMRELKNKISTLVRLVFSEMICQMGQYHDSNSQTKMSTSCFKCVTVHVCSNSYQL